MLNIIYVEHYYYDQNNVNICNSIHMSTDSLFSLRGTSKRPITVRVTDGDTS